MYRIAIVDDSSSSALLMTGYLKAIPDLQIFPFEDPITALSWCEEYVPDVILVDYMMPELNGLDFIQKVREDVRLADTPAIMITSADDKNTLHAALQMRATDFLRKPVDPIELIARTQNMLELRRRYRELSVANESLKKIANTDALTGLRNRRSFFAELQTRTQMPSRRAKTLCVALVDIDHFKAINDKYGHDVGDHALKHVARVLANGVRKCDIVGRIGGEEFAILMESELRDARPTCERLLRSLHATPVERAEHSITITASLGLAEFEPQENVDTFVKRSDEALYLAKSKGRNRMEVAQSSVTPARATAQAN